MATPTTRIHQMKNTGVNEMVDLLQCTKETQQRILNNIRLIIYLIKKNIYMGLDYEVWCLEEFTAYLDNPTADSDFYFLFFYACDSIQFLLKDGGKYTYIPFSIRKQCTDITVSLRNNVDKLKHLISCRCSLHTSKYQGI
jgi:hypothetical protein